LHMCKLLVFKHHSQASHSIGHFSMATFTMTIGYNRLSLATSCNYFSLYCQECKIYIAQEDLNPRVKLPLLIWMDLLPTTQICLTSLRMRNHTKVDNASAEFLRYHYKYIITSSITALQQAYYCLLIVGPFPEG
jgi:hypothetical protein